MKYVGRVVVCPFDVRKHFVYLFLFNLAGMVGASQLFGEACFEGWVNRHLSNKLVELRRRNAWRTVRRGGWSFIHV